MGDFGDLEYFYRGFEHGVMTERHRVMAMILDTYDCACGYDRGELVYLCQMHELIHDIEERKTYE